ncbi:MAG: hypothetical protein F4060_11220 [Holophagales bacterium]|nr:hypothetical protein [Holophagales bacterium]MYG32072.1 hypothetical protein [Holophagales bacterium]MYI80496.1 hypothetical protein [Holophagales bacterium]
MDDAQKLPVDPATPQAAELVALQKILGILIELDATRRQRILGAVGAFFDMPVVGASSGIQVESGTQPKQDSVDERSPGGEFGTFAELFHAAGAPVQNAEKALVGGFWLQVCQGAADGFKSYMVNRELKEAGFAISNITNAFSSLQARKPALVIQTGKTGAGAHARKLLKLTTAGIAAVDKMIEDD